MFTTSRATGHRTRSLLLGALITLFAASGPAQAERSWRSGGIAGLAIKDGELAAAVHRAVRGAARRLEQAVCARVLTQFNDGAGRPLDQVLFALDLTPPASLSRIIFRDGRDANTCRSGDAVAFTGPGSRVVFVCGERFASLDRSRAEKVVIHEMLHTLGLGERPPATGAIDRAVALHCGS